MKLKYFFLTHEMVLFTLRGYHVALVVVFLILIIALEAFNLWVLFRIPTADTPTCNSSVDYKQVSNARITSITILVLCSLAVVLILAYSYNRSGVAVVATPAVVAAPACP